MGQHGPAWPSIKVHNAYRIQLKGESMRKQTRKLTPLGSSD